MHVLHILSRNISQMLGCPLHAQFFQSIPAQLCKFWMRISDPRSDFNASVSGWENFLSRQLFCYFFFIGKYVIVAVGVCCMQYITFQLSHVLLNNRMNGIFNSVCYYLGKINLPDYFLLTHFSGSAMNYTCLNIWYILQQGNILSISGKYFKYPHKKNVDF